MNEEDIKLLNDFVKETPQWVKEMKYQGLYAKQGKDTGPCIWCGCEPEKMQQLADVVEKLLLTPSNK